jgi:hypothetical protein
MAVGPTPSAPAADPAADRAAIEAVVALLLAPTSTVDDKLGAIDRPDGLVPVLAQGLTDPRTRTLTHEITSTTFVDADTADVTLVITLPSSDEPLRDERSLRVVRTAAGWQTTRASWCELVSTGGYACPPDPAGDPATTGGADQQEIGLAIQDLFAPTATVEQKLHRIDRPEGSRTWSPAV